MRLLIYEWSCSGGLEPHDRPATPGAESLSAEGRMMFLALLRDAVRAADLVVTGLVDATRSLAVPAAARTRTVPRGAEIDTLVAEALHADATLIVAPETDGILADRVARVRQAGGRVVAPDTRFITLAADKQATVDALAAAGVPVPAGRTLAAREDWPAGFVTPAVRKARAAAGCEDLLIQSVGDPPPPPASRPSRIEALAAGIPVGVSCLCGPEGIRHLPPLRQRFSAGAAPRFIGCEPLADRALEQRAESLAHRAIAAVARAAVGQATEGRHAPAAGWIGVDMILGARSDGRDDRVLEVNPRLTTSFAGHAEGTVGSLVRTLVDVWAGREPSEAVVAHVRPLSFSIPDDDAHPPHRPARL